MLIFYMLLMIFFLLMSKNWLLKECYLGLGTFFSIMMISKSECFLGPLSVTFSSSMLICLSWWVCYLCMLASRGNVLITLNSPYLFSMAVSVMLTFLVFCFSSTSMLWFYFFFEATLLPISYIILKWGVQPERMVAATYMYMYTVMASLPLLIILCQPLLSLNKFFPQESCYSGWAFMGLSLLCFLVKLPIFPFHLWLPKAHVEAPVGGSMILAGILLKLGGFGLMQVSYFFHFNTCLLTQFIIFNSILGGVICSIICFRQSDLKVIVAYSSVGHMSLVSGGVMSFNNYGWDGALYLMVGHGLCSSGMFFMVNWLYSYFGSRSIHICKGLGSLSSGFKICWFFLLFSNIPTPPTLNFVAEVMLLCSIFSVFPIFFVFTGIMGYLSSMYNVKLYTSVVHGFYSQKVDLGFDNSLLNYMIFFFHFYPLVMLPLFVFSY